MQVVNYMSQQKLTGAHYIEPGVCLEDGLLVTVENKVVGKPFSAEQCTDKASV